MQKVFVNTHSQNSSALLLFRVGPVFCAAPAAEVAAVIRPPASLTRPPGSDPLRPGIFRHTGRLVSVTDLRRRFGVEAADPGAGRIVIVERGGRCTGYWVDAIEDILPWPATGWGPLPPLLPKGVFQRTWTRDGRIHLYAEFHRLERLPGGDCLAAWLESLAAGRPAREAPPPSGGAPADGDAAPGPPPPEPAAEAPARAAEPAPPPPPAPADRTAETGRERATRPAAVPRPAAAPAATVPAPSPVPPPAARAPAGSRTAAAEHASAPPTLHRRPDPLPRTPGPAARPAGRPEPPPAPPAAPVAPVPEPGDSGGTGWAAVALLLIAAGAAGLWWQLAPRTPPGPVHQARPALPAVNPVAAADPVPAEPVPLPPPAGPAAPRPPEDAAPATPSPTGPGPAAGDAPATGFAAAIEREGRDITIVLEAPPRVPVLRRPEPGEAKPPAPSDEPPAPEPAPASPPAPPEPREIVHIVVRGDTLWDIAERYVNDPFRYPELARLSRIRNPDLIYPGDRVRIVRRRH